MKARFWSLLALACLVGSAALADPPPSTAPPYRSGVSLQPIAIYDAAGNVVSSFGGGSGGGGASTVVGSQEQDVRSTGTLNAATLNAAINIPIQGQATVGLTISGLTASGATLTYEQSNDGGTTWTGVNEVNAGTGIPSGTRTTDGQTRISMSGRTNLRLRVSAVGTGTISVAWNISVREGIVTLGTALPPGANTIGGVFPVSSDTGKIVETNVAVAANTSTTLKAAQPLRIGLEIQCDGTAAVGVSLIGSTLTSVAAAPKILPAGSYPLYTAPFATLTAITAYTATAQTCRVTEYLR